MVTCPFCNEVVVEDADESTAPLATEAMKLHLIERMHPPTITRDGPDTVAKALVGLYVYKKQLREMGVVLTDPNAS
jgi:hypothetical protein